MRRFLLIVAAIVAATCSFAQERVMTTPQDEAAKRVPIDVSNARLANLATAKRLPTPRPNPSAQDMAKAKAPQNTPIRKVAIESIDDLLGKYVLNYYSYWDRELDINKVITISRGEEENTIVISNWWREGTNDLTATVDLEEGQIVIGTQRLYTNEFTSKDENGEDVNVVDEIDFTDQSIGGDVIGYINEDHTITFDGWWRAYVTDKYNYEVGVNTKLVKVNGTMTYQRGSETYTNEVAVVQYHYNWEKGHYAYIYNFGYWWGATVKVDFNRNGTFTIEEQHVKKESYTDDDGETAYRNYYTYGLTEDNKQLTSLTGTWDETNIVFGSQWTAYDAETYWWYGVLDPATITLTDGSTFEWPNRYNGTVTYEEDGETVTQDVYISQTDNKSATVECFGPLGSTISVDMLIGKNFKIANQSLGSKKETDESGNSATAYYTILGSDETDCYEIFGTGTEKTLTSNTNWKIRKSVNGTLTEKELGKLTISYTNDSEFLYHEANGIMTYEKDGETMTQEVYITQPDYRNVTIEGFGPWSATMKVEMLMGRKFSIPQKQLNRLSIIGDDGNSETVYYYVAGADDSNSEMSGTGTAEVLTFGSDWKLWKGSSEVRTFGPATINYTDGSTFLFPDDIPIVAATPMQPDVARISYDWDDDARANFTELTRQEIFLVDVDGNPLREDLLFYQICQEVNGEIKPITFTKDLYPGLDQDLTDIPFLYTDDSDTKYFIKSKAYLTAAYCSADIYFRFDTRPFQKIGVRAVYKGGGEIRESEIRWYTVSVPFKLNTLGWASFCSDYHLDLDDLYPVKAYRVELSENGSVANLKNFSYGKIWRRTGFILHGDPNATSYIRVTNSMPVTDTQSSDLIGVVEDTAVEPNTVLVLSNVNGVEGFYNFTGTTVPAGKAYLPKPEGVSQVKIFLGDDDTTDIAPQIFGNADEEKPAAVYDLSGRRIPGSASLQKGLYIVNGKKVVIK